MSGVIKPEALLCPRPAGLHGIPAKALALVGYADEED